MAHKNYPRHLARVLAIQALYQWQFNPQPLTEIIAQFLTEPERGADKADTLYFQWLVQEVHAHLETLDALIKPYIFREFSSINPVELAILRVATYELKCQLEIPCPVVINEAIELSKAFGAKQAHPFVNAVLDKLVPALREDEAKS